MWKIWNKEKDEKVSKIQVRGMDAFEFDVAEKWDITQINFEYNSEGRVSQMILYIENKGE